MALPAQTSSDTLTRGHTCKHTLPPSLLFNLDLLMTGELGCQKRFAVWPPPTHVHASPRFNILKGVRSDADVPPSLFQSAKLMSSGEEYIRDDEHLIKMGFVLLFKFQIEIKQQQTLYKGQWKISKPLLKYNQDWVQGNYLVEEYILTRWNTKKNPNQLCNTDSSVSTSS